MIPCRLLTFLGCCFLTTSLWSQAYLGFKGGINQSKSTYVFNIDPALTTGSGQLNGFYFGLPFEFQINEVFNFMPEVAVVSEGSVLSVQILEEQRTYNNAIIYTKVPLVAKLKLLQKKYYEFGVVGGVVPAFALDVNSYYFSSFDLVRTVNVDVNFAEAGIRRFDLALSVGMNTEKVIAKGWKIILDLRYNLGLLDVETHSNLTNTTEGFSLTLGILTPLFREKVIQ